jgi:hypothetical protein
MIPFVYPSSSIYGPIMPYHGFFASQGPLYFYVNTAATDEGMYAAGSDAQAANIGDEVVQLCVESVGVGGTPRFCPTGGMVRRRGPQRMGELARG